jgi:hypothetical protein
MLHVLPVPGAPQSSSDARGRLLRLARICCGLKRPAALR